jgi:flagellar hook-associated protein 2
MPGVQDSKLLSMGKIYFDKDNKPRISQKVDGIDVGELIEASFEATMAKAKPKQDEIDTNAKVISALAQFKTKMTTFQKACEHLSNSQDPVASQSNAFSTTAASLSTNDGSNPGSYAVITPSSQAFLGTFTLQVNQLAKADVRAGTITSPSLTTALGSLPTGTLTIGTLNPDGTTNSASQVSISVNNSMTLSQIQLAINNQTPVTGVSCEIDLISTGSPNNTYAFKLKAQNTGVPITLSDSTSNSIIQALGLPTTQTNISTLQSKITCDGQAYVRSTNNISDVVQGVTIDLVAPMTNSQQITATVGYDKAGALKAINDFVSAYNDLNTFVRDQQKFDFDQSKPADGADLYYNTFVKNTWSSCRSMIIGQVAGLAPLPSGGALTRMQYLSDIGITVALDGSMTVTNQNNFNFAIDQNYQALMNLFENNYTSSNVNIIVGKYPSSLDPTMAGVPMTLSIQNTTGFPQATITVNNQVYNLDVSATGRGFSGQAGTPLAGLTLSYTGIPTIGTGQTVTSTISITQGVAGKLAGSLQNILQSEGTYDSEVKYFSTKNKDLKNKIDKISREAEKQRDREILKYNHLYDVVSKYESVQMMLDSFNKVNK